jgi:putative nucleotidyltransferase with HDIG domain
VSRPPRLLARTLMVTVLTVAVILLVTFVLVTLDTRNRVRAAETEKLRVSERIFTALEQRRQQDRIATIAALTGSPTLNAALNTYFLERSFGGTFAEHEAELRETVLREVEKLGKSMPADVVAILDNNDRVFTTSGPEAAKWPLNTSVPLRTRGATFQDVVILPSGAFRVSGAPLRLDQGTTAEEQTIGTLVLATSLDANYAQDVSNLSNAGVVIVVNGAVVARTVPEPAARVLAASAGVKNGPLMLGSEEYAVDTMLASGSAHIYIYTLSSIDAAARTATGDALRALGTIGLVSFAVALLASVWLARTLTNPIDRLVRQIAAMTASRQFGRTIAATGSSRELDALGNAFNELMQGLTAAEAETRAAYLGAIRALAAALDARDPYTAGHSERVSSLSVLIARRFDLTDAQIDVIRLGALLHDIGKIGVPDNILRKAGPLTAEEFEQIKRHPGLGARILRQVPFLAAHLPIVELHHERPDGKGYPFGLLADDIPLDARIVHVADAFDAMTSARAYRPARACAAALTELQRCVGTEFDAAVVDALTAAMPSASALSEPELQELLGRGA